MATKAPKSAFLEGMRVLRCLSGTKNLGLQFEACKNSEEVVAYTDANFSVKRSQTGAVIKLGINAAAWRSMNKLIRPLAPQKVKFKRWQVQKY